MVGKVAQLLFECLQRVGRALPPLKAAGAQVISPANWDLPTLDLHQEGHRGCSLPGLQQALRPRESFMGAAWLAGAAHFAENTVGTPGKIVSKEVTVICVNVIFPAMLREELLQRTVRSRIAVGNLAQVRDNSV